MGCVLTADDYRPHLSPEAIGRLFAEGLTHRPGFLANSWELTSLVHVPAHEIVEPIRSAMPALESLPSDATVTDVDEVFRMAHRLGCKGITVYRDGARQGQVLWAPMSFSSPSGLSPRARSRVTSGKTTKFRMGCGTLFVTVNRDEEELCEVFANLGKAGGCPSQSEATCRAVSCALRSGVDPQALVEQLRGIRCMSTAAARKGDENVDVLSRLDAIVRALAEAMGERFVEHYLSLPAGQMRYNAKTVVEASGGVYLAVANVAERPKRRQGQAVASTPGTRLPSACRRRRQETATGVLPRIGG